MRLIISLAISLCIFFLISCTQNQHMTFLDIDDNSLVDSVIIQNSDAKSLKDHHVFRSKYKEYHLFKFTAKGYHSECLEKREILKKDTVYLTKIYQGKYTYPPRKKGDTIPPLPPIPPPPPCSFQGMKYTEHISKLNFDRNQNLMKFVDCAKSKCETKNYEPIVLTGLIDLSGEILKLNKVRGEIDEEEWEILSSRLDECKFNLGEVLKTTTARGRPDKEQFTFVICND